MGASLGALRWIVRKFILQKLANLPMVIDLQKSATASDKNTGIIILYQLWKNSDNFDVGEASPLVISDATQIK